jgi:hypothetical protein
VPKISLRISGSKEEKMVHQISQLGDKKPVGHLLSGSARSSRLHRHRKVIKTTPLHSTSLCSGTHLYSFPSSTHLVTLVKIGRSLHQKPNPRPSIKGETPTFSHHTTPIIPLLAFSTLSPFVKATTSLALHRHRHQASQMAEGA